MMLIRTLFLTLALASSLAAQTLVVQDGDDLAAIVASAPDQAVVEIASDATFHGTLSWAAKSLTVKARGGFSPVVKGSPGRPAIELSPTANWTVANLQGLTLEGGATPMGPMHSARFGHPTAASATLTVNVDDTVFRNPVLSLSLSTQNVQISVSTSTLAAGVRVQGSSTGSSSFRISDSVIEKRVELDAIERAFLSLELDRVHLIGAVVSSARDSSSVRIGSRSSLIESREDGVGTGILTRGSARGFWMNTTISGFAIGLDTDSTQLSIENALFHGNTIDLAPSVAAGRVTNSVIPDGTFAGVDGNLAHTPLLSGSFALSSDPVLLDKGNSHAAGLGLLDLEGNPRLIDDDGDGVAEVNFGAIARVVCATNQRGTVTRRQGFPPNPDVFGGSSRGPLVGTTWNPYIDHSSFVPNATLDLLVITGFPNNFFFPGSGTLLVDTSQLLYTQTVVPGERFRVPLNESCALPGMTVSCQAVTFNVGGTFRLTNALDLVLGLF